MFRHPCYHCSWVLIHGCFVTWWLQSNTIAYGSVDKALEGLHHSGGTRLYKRTFEALVRFKWKSLEKGFQLNFVDKMKKLREEATRAKLLTLCNVENFKQKMQQILAHSGIMGNWVTDYMRDINNFSQGQQHIEIKI